MSARVVEEEFEETEEEVEEAREGGVVAEEPVIRDEEIRDEGSREERKADAVDPGMTEEVKALLADPRPGPRFEESLAPDRTRSADVLLRVDRRAPYALVARVLEACASPEVRIVRVFFAVEGTDGAGEGAVGVFLPVDMGCGSKAWIDGVAVDLWLEEGSGGPGTRALADQLHGLRERAGQPLAVTLRAPGAAPFGLVAQGIDAALQAGAVNVFFHAGLGGERGWTAARWCERSQGVGDLRWRPSRPPRDLRPSTSPPGPRRERGYAGVVNRPQIGDELEEEILDESGAPAAAPSGR
jgi:hypothetical protein